MHLDAAVAISSLSLVVAAAALWYSRKQTQIARKAVEFSERSAKASEDSTKIAREAVSLGYRPYLTVKPIEITRRDDMDLPLSAKVIYTNSGTTPASDIICQAWMRAFETKPNPLPLHDSKTFPHPDLGAGDSQEIQVISGENYDMKTLSIAQSQSTIYLYGLVRYRDVTGHEHRLDWCFRYLPQTKAFHAEGA